MAQFGIHGGWKSIAALASLLTFFGLLLYASLMHLGPWHNLADPTIRATTVRLGMILYVLAILAIFFGFWSKEDTIAMGGIVGISLLMVMDVLLRVGMLGFNQLRVAGH